MYTTVCFIRSKTNKNFSIYFGFYYKNKDLSYFL